MPKTLFGEKFVDLVIPETPAATTCAPATRSRRTGPRRRWRPRRCSTTCCRCCRASSPRSSATRSTRCPRRCAGVATGSGQLRERSALLQGSSTPSCRRAGGLPRPCRRVRSYPAAAPDLLGCVDNLPRSAATRRPERRARHLPVEHDDVRQHVRRRPQRERRAPRSRWPRRPPAWGSTQVLAGVPLHASPAAA